MRSLFLVLCGLTAILAAPGTKILGGDEAVLGQFPYQISILYQNYLRCGGSIIDETTILTAAHCVLGYYPSLLSVKAGSVQISGIGQEHRVASVRVHGDYAESLLNDIAIIKLATPLEFNENIQPVSLPTSLIKGDSDVVISGWGTTSYPGTVPDGLRFIHLKSMDWDTCNALQTAEGWNVYSSQICTFTRYGEGVCSGDSGGPLVDTNGAQVGIVSWVTYCAVGVPDVYTSVHYYLDWIEENRQ
ncbi:PREDICTED: chymotrypsin-2-like [Nicrophorus vespilloides]|uniref:Chymotrypsin-2-like n=1 Tax=Nicrophorus vespilloides TaxID=110193 RepID=A0ABM1MW33_NICVS|nr:PREDICTED: chymotrypsin-2-like [Nicrophorus vespilloides]